MTFSAAQSLKHGDVVTYTDFDGDAKEIVVREVDASQMSKWIRLWGMDESYIECEPKQLSMARKEKKLQNTFK